MAQCAVAIWSAKYRPPAPAWPESRRRSCACHCGSSWDAALGRQVATSRSSASIARRWLPCRHRSLRPPRTGSLWRPVRRRRQKKEPPPEQRRSCRSSCAFSFHVFRVSTAPVFVPVRNPQEITCSVGVIALLESSLFKHRLSTDRDRSASQLCRKAEVRVVTPSGEHVVAKDN